MRHGQSAHCATPEDQTTSPIQRPQPKMICAGLSCACSCARVILRKRDGYTNWSAASHPDGASTVSNATQWHARQGRSAWHAAPNQKLYPQLYRELEEQGYAQGAPVQRVSAQKHSCAKVTDAPAGVQPHSQSAHRRQTTQRALRQERTLRNARGVTLNYTEN